MDAYEPLVRVFVCSCVRVFVWDCGYIQTYLVWYDLMEFTVNNPISIGYEFNQQYKSSSVQSTIFENPKPASIPIKIN